ncbi:hypothetical protein M440DRAFT_1328543, partial [Trichoderma longibrachiatum ATCC 18648]
MRQSLSNLKESFVKRLKRSHHNDTSSSAASDESQAAQSLDAPLQTASEATPFTRNGDLWDLAFSMVQKRESELMLAYEEYLSSLPGDAAVDANLSIPDFVKSVVDRAIQDREEKKWHVSLLGTDVEVRKQAERLVKLLLWSDPIVKSAVSSQPYAALAWSGVSILLPLVTGSVTQNEAMLKGFNSIGDVQIYWRICEESHLSPSNGPPHQQFNENLARLYSYIIEYQARVICHLSKWQLSRAWSGISSPGEWDAQIQQINRLDEECRNILGVLNADRIDKQWKEQLAKMQESQTLLDNIYQTLRESGRESRKTYEDKRATDLLRDLASDYKGHKDFNPSRVQGTCEWFFSDQRFRDWRNGEGPRLLWVSAGPGCGKSVLSKALIDERRLTTSVTTSTVCYFFFKDGDEGRMYAHNALCAILHQLFTGDLTGKLIEQALTSHRNFGKTLTETFSELWEILLRCAKSYDSGEIICLIDALDECHAASQMKLIKKLEDLSKETPSKLKFLITSRPYDDIVSSFQKLPRDTAYARFDGDDKSGEIGNEINLVIDARVDEIAQDFREKDRRLIANRLKSMENRTYLWLYLTIDIIKKSPSEYGRRVDIETLLSSLPAEVSDAYEKILDKSKKKDHTKALLQILLAATRPLTLEEANYALTLATKEHPYDSLEALENELWPMGTFQDHAKNLCGLFISVQKNQLSFIHQTAREFLLSSRRQGNWQGRFTMPKSHSTLSSACLRYLLLPDLPVPQINDDGTHDAATHPLLRYAAEYWPLHHSLQDAADASLSWKDVRKVCCAS